MQTDLEVSLATLLERYNLTRASVGVTTTAKPRFTVWVHWEGFSSTGLSCAHAHGDSVAVALSGAVGEAERCRKPLSEAGVDGSFDIPELAA